MHEGRSVPRFPILIFLAAISVLPLNMFVPSLPHIADNFGVDYAVINLAIGGYAIVMAVTQIVGGALSDKFGRRPIALITLGIFTAASIGCALATRADVFLVFRMTQGVIAAGQAIALAAIRDTWQGPEMRHRIGTLSSAWAVAPMLGPTLGGLLATQFGWRSNFIVFAVLGAVAFALVFTNFAETNYQRTDRLLQMDQYAMIAKSGAFWAYSILMALSIGTLYIFLGGAPTVAQEFGNLSGAYVGAMLGLLPAGFMLGSFVTARSATRIDPHKIIVIGRIVTLVGIGTGIILYIAGVNEPLAFFVPCMTIGLGNGLTMPSANAGVLNLAKSGAGAALGLASAITVSGAALLSFAAGFTLQAGNARAMTLLALAIASILALGVAAYIYLQALRRPEHITESSVAPS